MKFVIGWDAVEDMRKDPNARYQYEDVICRMENDKLYACNVIDINTTTLELLPDSQWYFWTTGLNDNHWEKLR